MNQPAQGTAQPILIHRLPGSERPAVERFLLEELDDISLYWRFFRTMTPAAVHAYVAQIPFGAQSAVFGAYVGERLAGVAELTSIPCGDPCAQENPGAMACAEFGIAVADRERHKGLGRMLLQRLLRHAWTTGLTRVQMSSLKDNHPMLSLATSVGFRKLREQSGEVIMRISRPGDWQVAGGQSGEIAAAERGHDTDDAAPRRIACPIRTLAQDCE